MHPDAILTDRDTEADHYVRLAVLALRLLAFLSIFLGINGLVFHVVYASFSTVQMTSEQSERLLAGVYYIFIGAILYIGSKPVGQRIGRTLH